MVISRLNKFRFFLAFLAPVAALGTECEVFLNLINEPITIESLINEMYPRHLVKNPEKEELSFSADEIVLRDGLVHFTRPRIEGEHVFLFENYCVETDVSLFGNTICIKSQQRTIDQTLCQQMGLQEVSAEDQPNQARLAEITVREHPRCYVYFDGTWKLEHLGRFLPRGTRYHVLDHFACRIN